MGNVGERGWRSSSSQVPGSPPPSETPLLSSTREYPFFRPLVDPSSSSCVHHPPSLFPCFTAVLFLPYLFVPGDFINAYPPYFLCSVTHTSHKNLLSPITQIHTTCTTYHSHMCYHESSFFFFSIPRCCLTRLVRFLFSI